MALRSLATFDDQLATEIRAIRAYSEGKRRRGRELFAKVEELAAKGGRQSRRGKRLFRRAGCRD